jgi:hypothetical protein
MLSDIRDSPHFEFVPLNVDNFTEICAVFDEVDEWMRSGPTRYGMRWLSKTSLDVPFNAPFLAKYRRAMTSEEAFDNFLNRQCELWDRSATMNL